MTPPLTDAEIDAWLVGGPYSVQGKDIRPLLENLKAARAALAQIANMPRGDYVMHGPRLPAAIARAALPQKEPPR